MMMCHYVFLALCFFIVTLCGGGIHRTFDVRDVSYHERQQKNFTLEEFMEDSNNTKYIGVDHENITVNDSSYPKIICRQESSIRKKMDRSPIVFLGVTISLFGYVRTAKKDELAGKVGLVSIEKLLKFPGDPKNLTDKIIVDGFKSHYICGSDVIDKVNTLMYFVEKSDGGHYSMVYAPARDDRGIRHEKISDKQFQRDASIKHKTDLRFRKKKKRKRFG